ncbi:MAG: MFS transporter [Salinivirgaceae bacterium]
MGNISLGLSAFWLGVIMIIPRLWDAFSDPIIGHLSDNTRSRWGRRRPFILIGGLFVSITFVVMWWIPKGEMVHAWFPSESGFQWFQLSYILFTLLLFYTAFNIFEIPHGALGMEMTTDYHARTRLFSAKSFTGNIFAMSTPWLFALANMEVFKGPGGNAVDGMRYVSLIIPVILIPLSLWWFFKLREPGFVKVAKQQKTPFWEDMKLTTTNKNFIMLTLTVFTLAMGFNFVQLIGSYYIAIYYVCGGDIVAGSSLSAIIGSIWAISGVLAVFPLNWISPKLGKRNTLIISILLMCLAQLSKIVCYNPAYPYLLIIPTILLSTGMLFFFTLGASMVGDICDEEELKSGRRTEGSFYAIFWWFMKLGTALASLVGGALIVFTMFDQFQGTKVDSLQGTVREFRSEIQYWQGNQDLSKTNTSLLDNTKEQVTKAIDESKLYFTVLEKESAKKQEKDYQNEAKYISQRKSKFFEVMATTDSTRIKLEYLNQKLTNIDVSSTDSLTKTIIAEAIPLILEPKLEKARMNSFELLAHLEGKSLESKKSGEHYRELIQNSEEVDKKLANISTTIPLEILDKELALIETEMVQLTQQSPYTLLMMRVVEIGLPLLLSIFSIFFILRYSLTEKRSHEIKDLLKQRNLEQKNE